MRLFLAHNISERLNQALEQRFLSDIEDYSRSGFRLVVKENRHITLHNIVESTEKLCFNLQKAFSGFCFRTYKTRMSGTGFFSHSFSER